MRHKLGGAMAAILGLKHIKGRHRNVRLVHESEVPALGTTLKAVPGTFWRCNRNIGVT